MIFGFDFVPVLGSLTCVVPTSFCCTRLVLRVRFCAFVLSFSSWLPSHSFVDGVSFLAVGVFAGVFCLVIFLSGSWCVFGFLVVAPEFPGIGASLYSGFCSCVVEHLVYPSFRVFRVFPFRLPFSLSFLFYFVSFYEFQLAKEIIVGFDDFDPFFSY